MRRFLVSAVLVALSAAISCSSDDPTLERRGGPLPTDSAAGKASGRGGEAHSAGGSPSSGDGGASGGVNSEKPIPFCQALAVMRAKCQRCHGDPLKNGAPVPFLSYEDTQAQYGLSELTYADVMTSVVEDDIMPYVVLNDPPTNLMPAVEPLTAEEKATLLSWLEQGAEREGGVDCQ